MPTMAISMSISMMTIRNGCCTLAGQAHQHRQWQRQSGIIIPRMMTFPRQAVVTKSSNNNTMLIRSLSQQLPSSSSSIASASAVALQSKEITTAIHHDDGGGTNGDGKSSSFFSYFGSLIQRIAYSMGIVYVVTEYGIEWTVCEGPSMMPTIKSRGEVILMDRFTPKLFGLGYGGGGGDTILERKSFALQCQKEHVNKLKQEKIARKKEKTEQFKRKGKNEQRQYNRHNNNSNNTHYQKQQHEEEEPTQLIVHSNPNTTLEEEKQSVYIPTKNNSNSDIKSNNYSDGIIRCRSTKNDNNANVEKLKRVVFDEEDDDEEKEEEIEIDETWFETRIPVNTLPSDNAWNRFWNQITTGISTGDVVVLQHPDRIGTVCKRVMGLPGDIVTKPSSQLGADRLELLLNNSNDTNNQDQQQQRRLKRKIRRRILSSGIEVPDGHIWVEGDNPWNSSDSRNYGAIPASLIMGRVLCRLWPLRGNAMMERGDRPIHHDGSDDPRASLTFSGSIIFPVGWEDQRIIREYVEPAPKMTAHQQQQRRLSNRNNSNIDPICEDNL